MEPLLGGVYAAVFSDAGFPLAFLGPETAMIEDISRRVL